MWSAIVYFSQARPIVLVMPGHSRPKDGVATLAYVPGIHAFLFSLKQGVDGRDKPGHDERKTEDKHHDPSSSPNSSQCHTAVGKNALPQGGQRRLRDLQQS